MWRESSDRIVAFADRDFHAADAHHRARLDQAAVNTFRAAMEWVGLGFDATGLALQHGRLIAPFWDLQAGVRYAKPRPGAPARGYAVIGVQGLAPYRFEVQAAAFVSERGNISARAELEYELLLTQRWILQPRFASTVAFQEVKELGIGRGVNDVEVGLRLRYEITREFAPYVGAAWQTRYGGSAQFARERGEDPGGWRLVAGLRAWF